MIEGLYGSIIFGRALGRIHTPNEIGRKYSGRYGSHMVHLQKPLLEWAGSELIKIELKVSLNSSWCGNLNALLDQWHYYHDNGLAAPLIIGSKPMASGLSLFVITDLSETHKHWLSPGQLIAAELSVSFSEYIPFVSAGAPLNMAGFAGFGG